MVKVGREVTLIKYEIYKNVILLSILSLYIFILINLQPMNINTIDTHLPYLNSIGQTLNVSERSFLLIRINLQIAIIKLTHHHNYDNILFWGRIEGIYKNYYICLAIKSKEVYTFPIQQFFWWYLFLNSSDDFQFAQLPKPLSQNQKEIAEMRDSFTGQHQKIIKKASGIGKVIKNKDDQIIIPPKNITELDRLSIIVNCIQHDCQLFPKGAYKMIPTHEIIQNQQFRGLNFEEVSDLSNYFHYRKAESKDKINLIGIQILTESDQAIFRDDFLDNIGEDKPKGCWSIQRQSSKMKVSVRSLVWPGYVGYHRVNSNIFGGMYMGDGIKNSDLHFII